MYLSTPEPLISVIRSVLILYDLTAPTCPLDPPAQADRGTGAALLAALKAVEDDVRGKWLCIAANFSCHGPSLVHYLGEWTQAEVDRAWVDLKDGHGFVKGFGKTLPPTVEGVHIFRATREIGRNVKCACGARDWYSFFGRGHDDGVAHDWPSFDTGVVGVGAAAVAANQQLTREERTEGVSPSCRASLGSTEPQPP